MIQTTERERSVNCDTDYKKGEDTAVIQTTERVTTGV